MRIIIIKRRKIHPVNHRSPGDRGRRSVRRQPYPRPAPAREAWDAVAVCRMRTRRLVGQPCIPLLAKADAFERMGRRSRRSGDRPRSPPRERAVRAGSPRQRLGKDPGRPPPLDQRAQTRATGGKLAHSPTQDSTVRARAGTRAGSKSRSRSRPLLHPARLEVPATSGLTASNGQQVPGVKPRVKAFPGEKRDGPSTAVVG